MSLTDNLVIVSVPGNRVILEGEMRSLSIWINDVEFASSMMEGLEAAKIAKQISLGFGLKKVRNRRAWSNGHASKR